MLTLQLPERIDQLASNRQRWAEVLADPQWNGTRGRIETNAFGQIILSPPPGGPHSSRQSQISYELRVRLGDKTVTEAPVSTADGVKGLDVGWYSPQRYNEVRGQVAFEIAPEICVEVMSPSNTDLELQHKRVLYFDAGAIECWQCGTTGEMSYYHAVAPNTPTSHSKLCPSFPQQIED